MPNEPSKKQTQSFLRRRFAEIGVQPRAKLGQNFLIDLNLQHALVDAADLGPNDVVLEVGTGTGSLTALMAPQAARVVTVEVDVNLHALAAEELSHFDNIRMLQFDVLKNKNQLAPKLLETLEEELGAEPGRCLKLAANLPYHVATPLMSNLLMLDWAPKQMTVTIQKELADRIVARPRTKDYSSLSIWMQSQCRTEILRVMAPSVFWPRPKVTSAIVQVTLDPKMRDRLPDRTYFHQFVRSMFFHRRKFLRSELLSAFKNQLDKPQVDGVMTEMGLAPTARAEELSVNQMLDLCERMMAVAGD
jgi:16S rRNA (adenine1518-N6/adenine1519-N6)-dimethyltransferase